MTSTGQRALSGAILLVASLLGIGAFLYPFFLPAAQRPGGAVPASGMMAHTTDAPLVFVVLLVLCLVSIFAGLAGRQMTSKMVALLGILTALTAVLRALPGPGGFNAIFLLPVLAGYCYGPTFGFLLGALALLVSALIGGGVGPWLPYQMFATGWVGLLSGLLPDMSKIPGAKPPGRVRGRRLGRWEPVVLAVWAGALGFIFGAIMNVWFWPYLAGAPAAGAEGAWQPGMGAGTTLRNYLVFYLATSLVWDLGRAAGNALLVLFLARPVLRVLRRFRTRFQFEIVPDLALTAD